MSIYPNNNYHFVFFGTPEAAVTVLDELESAGLVPSLVVTNPDRPQGRKLIVTPPPAKVWAEERDIAVYQPASLKDGQAVETIREAGQEMGASISKDRWDFFVVTAYSKIIPQEILDLPTHGSLNVHPSLLPALRGPSPIQTSILQDQKNTGVTIIVLDAEMDHGPIIAQEKLPEELSAVWPVGAKQLEKALFVQGGKLLARTLPGWIDGTIKGRVQNDAEATYCKKITKADGEIKLTDLSGRNAWSTFLKIKAHEEWPGTYFFTEPNSQSKQKRVIIKDALFHDGVVILTRVIPEGKGEMSYEEFLKANY